MGLVGAGTNNAATRANAPKSCNVLPEGAGLFVHGSRLTGLGSYGQGDVGHHPFFCDRGVMSRPAVAGLMGLAHGIYRC